MTSVSSTKALITTSAYLDQAGSENEPVNELPVSGKGIEVAAGNVYEGTRPPYLSTRLDTVPGQVWLGDPGLTSTSRRGLSNVNDQGRADQVIIKTAGILNLSASQLSLLVKDLPAAMQAKILADPAGFSALVQSALDQEPSDLLTVVDKQHDLPKDFVPGDLVPLSAYPDIKTLRSPILARPCALAAFQEMLAAAKKDGIKAKDLVVSYGYRSYDLQKSLYDKDVRTLGTKAAELGTAQPGHSQHQLGTAFDIGGYGVGYEKTPAGKWLLDNGWKFGFSMSYPEGSTPVTGYRFEAWHYRYIGKDAARLQREFFGDSQYYLLSFLAQNADALRAMGLANSAC